MIQHHLCVLFDDSHMKTAKSGIICISRLVCIKYGFMGCTILHSIRLETISGHMQNNHCIPWNAYISMTKQKYILNMNAVNLVVYYQIFSYDIFFHESYQVTIPISVCFLILTKFLCVLCGSYFCTCWDLFVNQSI